MNMKTFVEFINETEIHVIALNGESIYLKLFFPVPEGQQQDIANLLAYQFDQNFSEDKSTMIYFVLCKMMTTAGFSFTCIGNDRIKERERIGARIRELREKKGFDANKLATLAGIDAGNLCRIEQGKYSVGIDILTKIVNVLGAKIDLVEV